jgi:CheY-like chemotaxis protein
MLEQVVMNLCVNARDAMPRGGDLTLATQELAITEEAARDQTEARPGRYICLTVSDTGCGMDETLLTRIFEPFFTTKEPGRGTGLGLATVYGIIKQHLGWVTVDSSPGKGTRFRVFLPKAPALEEDEEASLALEPSPRGTETLLVVEDDQNLRRMLGIGLSRLGYRILESANGAEALRVWHQSGANVHLLLTDMVMPEGMTGVDLARRLREQNPELKVLITSGYSADLLKHDTLAGMSFLAKPYSISDLARTLRACLNNSAPVSE